MWQVVIPEVPKPRVRLVDVVASAVLYGLILAILSRVQSMQFYHFTTAFSMALFFLTYRIYGKFRRDPANSGVVFSHFFSATSHFTLMLYLIVKGAMPDLNVSRPLMSAEMIAILTSFTCGFVALVSSSIDVKECVQTRRYGRALYGAMGGIPALVELIVALAVVD